MSNFAEIRKINISPQNAKVVIFVHFWAKTSKRWFLKLHIQKIFVNTQVRAILQPCATIIFYVEGPRSHRNPAISGRKHVIF